MLFEDLFEFLSFFINCYDYLSLDNVIIKQERDLLIIIDNEYLELFYLVLDW